MLLSDEVGSHQTLLVLCTAFRANTAAFSNLTIKKIPNTVLTKCEWGHDDYSLAVENLPSAPKSKVEHGGSILSAQYLDLAEDMALRKIPLTMEARRHG